MTLLRHLRREAGMSLETIEKQTGIKGLRIASAETGKLTLSKEELQTIGYILGVEPDDLLTQGTFDSDRRNRCLT